MFLFKNTFIFHKAQIYQVQSPKILLNRAIFCCQKVFFRFGILFLGWLVNFVHRIKI